MKMYNQIKNMVHAVTSIKRKRYIQSLINKGMLIGQDVEIIEDFFFDPSHCYLISIGDNCTICPNVRLIAHDASTKKSLGFTKLGRITIQEGCFIGDSVIVLPGTEIGAGAIVGAGSIVTKDVPAGMIAAGNPAKVIGSVKDYIERIDVLSRSKRVFDERYHIQNLDETARRELLDTIGNEIGFIV